MTLEEKVHYVAVVTVKKVTKTTATDQTVYGKKPVQHEAARTENTVVNLTLSDDELDIVLAMVMEHLRLHRK